MQNLLKRIAAAAFAMALAGSTVLKRKLGHDDSLDVFGVHGIGSYVGTIELE